MNKHILKAKKDAKPIEEKWEIVITNLLGIFDNQATIKDLDNFLKSLSKKEAQKLVNEKLINKFKGISVSPVFRVIEWDGGRHSLVDILKIFYNHGANFAEAKDSWGKISLLHYAANKFDFEAASFLFEKCPQIKSAKNHLDKTPFDILIESIHFCFWNSEKPLDFYKRITELFINYNAPLSYSLEDKQVREITKNFGLDKKEFSKLLKWVPTAEIITFSKMIIPYNTTTNLIEKEINRQKKENYCARKSCKTTN